MARKLRVQYPGAIYHVMNRGDRREAIFVDEVDRDLLIATLGQAWEKTAWQIHAWCLMSNKRSVKISCSDPKTKTIVGCPSGRGQITRFKSQRDFVLQPNVAPNPFWATLGKRRQ